MSPLECPVRESCVAAERMPGWSCRSAPCSSRRIPSRARSGPRRWQARSGAGSSAPELIERAGGLRVAKIVVLCDVRTPFEDAARVFGPQKGADPELVERLTARLHELAATFPRDPRGVPLTGCAGGLSGGLWAALGATLEPGAQWVLDVLDFDER